MSNINKESDEEKIKLLLEWFNSILSCAFISVFSEEIEFDDGCGEWGKKGPVTLKLNDFSLASHLLEDNTLEIEYLFTSRTNFKFLTKIEDKLIQDYDLSVTFCTAPVFLQTTENVDKNILVINVDELLCAYANEDMKKNTEFDNKPISSTSSRDSEEITKKKKSTIVFSYLRQKAYRSIRSMVNFITCLFILMPFCIFLMSMYLDFYERNRNKS